MSTLEKALDRDATHEVANQPPPLENYNTFETDRVLVEALRREGGEWAVDHVREIAAAVPTVVDVLTTATATGSTRSAFIRPGTP